MKVIVTLEIADQPRTREMVAMWAHGLVNTTVPVFHPMSGLTVGEIRILDFDSAETAPASPAKPMLTPDEMRDNPPAWMANYRGHK